MSTTDEEARIETGDDPVDPHSGVSERLRVTALASGGDGVGRLSDGRVVFIDGGVPGDLVEITDFEVHKKLAKARIGALLEPSPDRIQPRCAHFETCGGCRWQHVRYEAQLEAKRRMVRDAFERIGGLEIGHEIEILGSPDPYGYRARARWVASEGLVGYRMRRSHEIQAITECPVLVSSARESLAHFTRSIASASPHRSAATLDAPPSGARGRGGITEWIVSAGTSGPATLHKANRKSRSDPRRKPSAKAPVRDASQSVTLDVLGERLQASAESFIQGNALLWDALAQEVCSQCTADGEAGRPTRFVELYAGIGFLTLPLARRGLAGIAIESSKPALADLVFNLEASGLAKQVEVIEGRVETRRDLTKRLSAADILLVDPPRIGLETAVRDAIASAGPDRLVYVSCDPATLARDLRVLSAVRYRLISVRALDLFPQTPHVEVVVRLERTRA